MSWKQRRSRFTATSRRGAVGDATFQVRALASDVAGAGFVMKDGRMTRGGGIEWTIKNGIPYHVPTLMKEVKAMVDADRKKTEARPTAP